LHCSNAHQQIQKKEKRKKWAHNALAKVNKLNDAFCRVFPLLLPVHHINITTATVIHVKILHDPDPNLVRWSRVQHDQKPFAIQMPMTPGDVRPGGASFAS